MSRSPSHPEYDRVPWWREHEERLIEWIDGRCVGGVVDVGFGGAEERVEVGRPVRNWDVEYDRV